MKNMKWVVTSAQVIVLGLVLTKSEVTFSQKKSRAEIQRTDAPVAATNNNSNNSFTSKRPGSQLDEVRRRQDEAMLRGAKEKELKEEMQALEMILGNKLRKD